MYKILFITSIFIISGQSTSEPHEILPLKSQTIKHIEYGRPPGYSPKGEKFNLYPTGGTFCELEDGQVVFFSNFHYFKFQSLLSNRSAASNEKLIFWNPKTQKTKVASVPVRSLGPDNLTINNKQVTFKSLKRLRLSSNWKNVLHKQWPEGCSIVDLGNSRFLITGGYSVNSDKYGPTFSDLARATVFNTETNTVEKQFNMNSIRVGHSAVLLPSGRVFCVGGEMPKSSCNSSAEIIDVSTGTSITISKTIPSRIVDATIITDTQGNPLIFGGHQPSPEYSSKRIIRYNVKSELFEEAGTMRKGRYFERVFIHNSSEYPNPKPNQIIEECAEQLKNGQYVVDRGDGIWPSRIADFASGPTNDAEIICLKNK